MAWIIVLLIVIVLVFVFPKILKALMILLGVLLCIGLIWYVDNKREEGLSKKRISGKEVVLADFLLGRDRWGWEISGRIKNNSQKHTLTSFDIKMRIRDCIAPGDCEIVGEAMVDLVESVVPPGQSRSFRRSVFGFPKPDTIRGKYDWSFSIIEITGRPYEARD